MNAVSIYKVIFIILTISAVSWAGTYSGGSGTEGDPYKIATPADWQELTDSSDDLSAHFILTNNIDLSGISNLTPVGVDLNPSISFNGTPFSGVFDGEGYVISNVTISSTYLLSENYVALFGSLGTGGEIRNLGVENIEISGNGYVGGLVGLIAVPFPEIGGIINNCYTTGLVTGNGYVGGLLGKSDRGTISNCYTSVEVTGNNEVGGLIGSYYSSTTSDCYATGSVTATGLRIGGLSL